MLLLTRWPPLHSIIERGFRFEIVGAAIGRPGNRYWWQQEAGGRWPPLHSISDAVSDLNVGAAIGRPGNRYRWQRKAGGRWPPLHSISDAGSDLNVGAAIGVWKDTWGICDRPLSRPL